MDIIIVGCGKVGTALAQTLSEEKHSVTVIDMDEGLVNQVVNDYDVRGFVGNCLSTSMLDEADVAKTNIFISTTDSDELNILSCLIARKMGARHSVARVRNPEYRNQLVFMREELGISMMVNPDYIAANEIANILRYPTAIKIESFGKGRVDLAELKITEDSILANKTLVDVSKKLKLDVLVCAVQHGEEIFIPSGSYVLKVGDKIHLTASHSQLVKFFRAISDTYRIKSVKSAMLIGGGRIAYHLASQLREIGITVKIIEQNEERCKELSKTLDNVKISCGDGTDQSVLEEEGIADADAVVTITGIDEENIILSLYAQKIGTKKVVTKVNRLSLLQFSDNFGLDSIVSPKSITVSMILQYVRGKQNSGGSGVITLYRLANDRLEALEFVIRKRVSYVDVPLKDMQLRNDVIIASIIRGSKLIVPRGDDCIKMNDNVIVITSSKGLHDINEIFN